MDISSVRLKLSAIAKFQPAAPGSLNAQEIGFFDLSADIAGCTVAHAVRLSITNFGSAAEGFSINASTLAVASVGGGAAATINDGEALDYDHEALALAFYNVIGMRVISGENLGAVLLNGTNLEMRASVGTFSIVSTDLDGGSLGASLVLTGPAGAQDTPTVVELLFIGA